MRTLSVLWRRLDVPGHDACRIALSGSGCELDGTAVFEHSGAAARLAYVLVCDESWRTVRGSVHGFVGPEPIDVLVERRSDGGWTVDGEPVPGLESIEHLDYGFTPATNFPQLRQLARGDGRGGNVPVTWLDVPPARLVVLEQRYERRSATTWWYEAPRFGYSALLELTPDGLVRRYPGLWERERSPQYGRTRSTPR
ncbi:MAG TPA: putative glycolipid-binding domain-containing protein [Anaeromyxobacteraceae bacterium]|nr:putative glycolipid-binding domain-containing protein [Anaeromyxobacteraceae bacterium]